MNVKPCNVSQEQRRIINQNIFRSECEKFFGKINRYSLKSNIFLFGKLVDSNGKKGLNAVSYTHLTLPTNSRV